jgi:bacteriorhodopsin
MRVHSCISPVTLACVNCRTAFPAAAMSWLSYPFVHIIKSVALPNSTAILYSKIGNSFADVIAKTVFDVLILAIRSEKSAVKNSGKLQDLGVFLY